MTYLVLLFSGLVILRALCYDAFLLLDHRYVRLNYRIEVFAHFILDIQFIVCYFGSDFFFQFGCKKLSFVWNISWEKTNSQKLKIFHYLNEDVWILIVINILEYFEGIKDISGIQYANLSQNSPQKSKIFLKRPSGKSFDESSMIWPSINSWIFFSRFSRATASCPTWLAETLEEIFLAIVCRTSRYFSTCFSTSCSSSPFLSSLVDLLTLKCS